MIAHRLLVGIGPSLARTLDLAGDGAESLAGGVHEFFEAGLLSSVLMLEAAVEVIRSATATWITLALVVFAPLACLAWDWWQAPVPEIPTQPNGVHP